MHAWTTSGPTSAHRAALLRHRLHRTGKRADAGRGDLDRRHGLRPRRHRQPRRRPVAASACAPRWPRPSATTSTARYCRDVLAGQEGSTSRSRASRTAGTPPSPSRSPTTATAPWSPTASRAAVSPGRADRRPARGARRPRPPRSRAAARGSPRPPRTARSLRRRRLGPHRQWSADLLDQLALCHAFLPNADRGDGLHPHRQPRSPPLGTLADLVPRGRGHRRRRRRGRRRPAPPASTRDVPALAVDVLDPTGAGDVFGAALRRRHPRRLAAGGTAAVRRPGRRSFRAASRRGAGRAGLVRRATGGGARLTDPDLKRAYGFLADRIPADAGPPVHYAPVTPPARTAPSRR